MASRKPTYEQEKEEVQAAQNDPKTFGVLYERYFEQIFRYIFRKCQSEDTAGDLTQQTFIKALKNLPKYEFKGAPFSAWLYKIASNELYQMIRQSKKEAVYYAEYEDLREVQLEDDSSLDLKSIGESYLKTWLAELKPASFRIIELRFFDQLSFKEISEIEGIGESAAKMKTYRAIEQLKKLMQKDPRLK